MNKKYNLNLGLVTEDLNTNDFLYVWEQLGKRPCRTNIYSEFSYKEFIEVLLENNFDYISYVNEINGDENNIRNFMGDSSGKIFVSFLLVQEGDDKNVFDVSIIHDIVDITDLISNLRETSLGDFELDEEESVVKKHKIINTIISTPEGIKVIPYVSKDIDMDSIDDLFDDDVIKEYKKIIKNVNSKKGGLYLIDGIRGNGKTTLLNFISKKVKCDVVYFPVASFDILSTIDMTDFLETHKEKLFIFDDFDIFDNYRTSTVSNSIMNIVDNYLSHLYNISCIVCTNNITDFDVLRSCNNLKGELLIDGLEDVKIKQLCKDNKVKYNKNFTKLVDIFKTKYIELEKNIKEVGY